MVCPTCLLDEVAQHDLGDVKVGNDAILERTLGNDRTGCATNHALSVGTHRQDSILVAVDGNDGGLIEHNALPAPRHKRIGGS